MRPRVPTSVPTFATLLCVVTLLVVGLAPVLARADVGVVVGNNGGFTFEPRDIVIPAGETVIWTWADGFHTTTNGVDSNDPGAGLLWDAYLYPGQKTASYEFDTPGYYPYFCRFHDALDMKGSVTVLRSRVAVRYKASSDTEPTSWGVIKSLYK